MSYSVEFLPAATEAIDLASEISRTMLPGEQTEKGDRDFATEVDYKIEQEVRDHLNRHFPEIGFVGEEEGRTGESSDMWWVLDPIDGTVNFVHGLPLWGISLALIDNNSPVLGLVDLPLLNNRYTAVQDDGATCNGTPLHVSDIARLSDAVVTIGDYAVGDSADERNAPRLHLTALLADRALRIRMLGSAALDLVWLAEGRIDASLTLSNNSWDVSAGALIAKEAGAVIFDIDGLPHDLSSSSTLASTPALKNELLSILSQLQPLRPRTTTPSQ